MEEIVIKESGLGAFIYNRIAYFEMLARQMKTGCFADENSAAKTVQR